MTLGKEENTERMAKKRATEKERMATEKEAERMAERTAIIDGVAAKIIGQLNDIASSIAENLERVANQRKMSCLEESLNPAPHTPPKAITGGMRGRSPALGSGNGRKKTFKQEAPTPPTASVALPPTPPTPLSPLVTPVRLPGLKLRSCTQSLLDPGLRPVCRSWRPWCASRRRSSSRRS